MDRPLPPWAPIALVGFGVFLFFGITLVPRDSEVVDTILEAVPFLVFFIALIAVPFSQKGLVRHVGLAVALFLAFSPWWFPAALIVLEDATADRSSVILTVTLRGEGPYRFAFPAFTDGEGTVAAVHDDLPRQDPEARLVVRDGVPFVQVDGTGETDWSSRAEGGKGDEWWPTTEWTGGDPVLLDGQGPVAFTIQLDGEGRWCGGTITWSGTVSDEGVAWDQQEDQMVDCV